MAISIATHNINGLREENKRMSFIQWLLWLNVDILSLQETYIASRKECNAWFSSAGYDSIISPGSNHCRGSVILYRKLFILRSHCTDYGGQTRFGGNYHSRSVLPGFL